MLWKKKIFRVGGYLHESFSTNIKFIGNNREGEKKTKNNNEGQYRKYEKEWFHFHYTLICKW